MDVESIRRYCLSFPQATEDMPWPDDLCFKVGGRIFAAVSLHSVPQSISFKCTAEQFAELVEQEGINPAPYVGRYKWVRLERPDVLCDAELEDLIRQSYEMVSTKTKAKTKTLNRRDRREKKKKKK
jgi:predicted DNA-binding protein (MmcQ/YjbR family)